MKLTFKILSALLILFAIGCGEKEEKEQIKLSDTEAKKTVEEATTTTAEVNDLDNKGIGPVKSVEVSADIDAAMATKGEELFKNMCSACHKMDKKFIGPELSGVTERRSPEWIMNMILNPEQMIKEDPIAKKLLIESNMAVMANQNLSEEEARAILEYFRQFDQQN
ncbi:c-type cytochrome [Salinimicrobium flavum]|uniref:C-type cytochrome n=1 Tax=Salinimicrobium flavum TaxID=1737065 RepID=A0ABW5IYX5_9FLAO